MLLYKCRTVIVVWHGKMKNSLINIAMKDIKPHKSKEDRSNSTKHIRTLISQEMFIALILDNT